MNLKRGLAALVFAASILTSGQLAPVAAATLPKPERVTLSNGMTLLVVYRPELPIVSVDAVVKAGAVDDPKGKSGLAELTANLLKRGTKTRTAPQIAETIDSVGGELSTVAGSDSSAVRLSVLSKDLDIGLNLMADVLLRPAFKPEELTKLKEEETAGLKSSLDDANDVLQRTFRKVVLADNPYGQMETLTSLGAIGPDDIKQFYARHYRPNNVLVSVVGDITPAQARERFSAIFGGWSRQEVSKTQIPALKPVKGRRVVVVNQDVSQSFIMLGHPGVQKNNPDYFPLLVLNFVLGGDFTSRLNMSIRDRQGLAYGAGSRFTMFREAGYFSASLSTRTATTSKALDSLLEEIEGIRKEPVTPAELRSAKAYLTGSFPLRFETNAQLAGEMVSIELNGLSEDFLATFRQKVEAVTAADVQRVAQKYLHPDAYDLVVVTKAKEVKRALEAYGSVEEWSKEKLLR